MSTDPQSAPLALRRLPKEEFKKYLYAPPLEVPPNYSPQEAFRKMVEEGNCTELEIAARKACRLIIEAAGSNESVKRWLLSTRTIGDGAWNKLMVALGTETPEITRQINALGPSYLMLNWCVSSAAYLISEL